MGVCSACGYEVPNNDIVSVGTKNICAQCADYGMGAMVSRITGLPVGFIATRLWVKQYVGFEPPVWAYLRTLEADATWECWANGEPRAIGKLGDLYGS